MRLLILHVNSFCCTITTKGRSRVYEDYDDPVTRVDEALVVLSSVEKGDEHAPELVATRATAEIVKLATQLKVVRVVVHPFAHLFAELVDGVTSDKGGFVLNTKDIGLLRSLDKLSAADASRAVNDGARSRPTPNTCAMGCR